MSKKGDAKTCGERVAVTLKSLLVMAATLLATAGVANANDARLCADSFTKQQWSKALPACSSAANAGDVGAQIHLGIMYDFGLGVVQDYRHAVHWFRRAAEAGSVSAMFNLATMYRDGRGIAQDYIQAVRWYTISAEQGSAVAQLVLAEMYQNGKGIGQDYRHAFHWYTRAAELGNARAQFSLGLMYFIGQGVVQDFVRSYMWLNLSAAAGSPEYRKQRDVVIGFMTSEQVAKAQQMAAACVARNYKNC